jgi:hypothetical protein
MNPIVFWIDAHLIVALPLFVASYLGGIAAPKSQLGAASIVVPVLALLLINIGPSLGTGRWGTSILPLLEEATGCAAAAVLLYFKWKRHAGATANEV